MIAVGGVVGGVQIQRDAGRQLAAVVRLETLDARGDGEVDQLLQRRDRHRILKSAERRLAGQSSVLGPTVGGYLEDRIVAQRIVIVAVFIAGKNAEQTLAEHLDVMMLRLRLAMFLSRIAGRPVIQTRGHSLGVLRPPIKLRDRQQSGVAGQLPFMLLDNDG